MHKYIEGEEISEPEIRKALRAGTISLKLVPVVTGSAFKNKGVQTLLDAVVDYLPSPLDVPPVEGINPKTDAIEAQTRRGERAICRPGVQDHGRQAPGPVVVCAHL